jgi:hypothetical protein
MEVDFKCISAVELNGGTFLGMPWLSRKFHQLELLIYCWQSVKGGQLSAKVPKTHTQQPPKYFGALRKGN